MMIRKKIKLAKNETEDEYDPKNFDDFMSELIGSLIQAKRPLFDVWLLENQSFQRLNTGDCAMVLQAYKNNNTEEVAIQMLLANKRAFYISYEFDYDFRIIKNKKRKTRDDHRQ